MVEELLTVIGREDHQGLVVEPQFAKRIEQTTDPFIRVPNLLVVEVLDEVELRWSEIALERTQHFDVLSTAETPSRFGCKVPFPMREVVVVWIEV